MIEIIKYEVKKNGNRYTIEIQLSKYVPYDWTSIYNEAISKMGGFTSMSSTGCPTIDKVRFFGDIAKTTDFPEFAIDHLENFKNEFKKVMAIANTICISRRAIEQQREEEKKEQDEEKKKQLEEINKRLNKK